MAMFWKKKQLLAWSFVLGIVVGLFIILYLLFGHSLIARAYESGGGFLFKDWFKDRDVIPLREYLTRGDWAAWSLSFFPLAFLFGLLIVSSLRPRRFFLGLTGLILTYLLLGHVLIRFLYQKEGLVYYARLIHFLNRIHGIEHVSSSPCGPIPLEEYLQRSDIFVFQIILFLLACAGLVWIFQKKTRRALFLINLILLVPVLMLTEFYLNLEDVQKKFGSVQWKTFDHEINFKKIRLENHYGFSDRERTHQKSPGTVFRAAVLGDSFVWGHGIPPEDIWSHLLEAKLKEQYGDRVEVLSWGKNRWSTQDQFRFLKAEGEKFDIDLLIFGFVTNDPEMQGFCIPMRMFLWDRWVREIPFFRNTFRFLADRLNGVLYGLRVFKNWGYAGWENNLYQGENWKEYEKLLIESDQFLKERKIPYFFVTLPMPQPKSKAASLKKYGLAFELFERNGIPYLDLSPEVERRFGHLTHQQIKETLWANPVNSHPNRNLTQLYAAVLSDYLQRKGYLAAISKR